MNRDELITLLLRRAGQREGDTKLKEQLVDELKLLQRTYEQSGVQLPGGGVFWPTFLLSEVSTAYTEESKNRIPLPDDFLMEYEDGALFLKDGTKWRLLEKYSWDELRERNSGESQPRAYAILGRYFYLFPVPDGEYELKLIYYQAAAELSSDGKNLWTKEAPGLLIAGLGVILAGQYLYDNNLREQFVQQQGQEALRFYNKEIALAETNFDRIKGL